MSKQVLILRRLERAEAERDRNREIAEWALERVSDEFEGFVEEKRAALSPPTPKEKK
jgi:hypothetical protein